LRSTEKQSRGLVSDMPSQATVIVRYGQSPFGVHTLGTTKSWTFAATTAKNAVSQIKQVKRMMKD
jgi:hypothetical protein